ncbi:MAG TPA: hypothetical protein VHE30_00890 [Polyangiaceae bacterium]|nr:hypothetical protein [Polyangiaceae bacterium]
MPNLLTLTQLRDLVQATIEDVAASTVAKPRLFELPRPDQQIQFELAARLRDGIRERLGNPSWDRLFFDASDPAPGSPMTMMNRPPIYVDTRQLFGAVASGTRSATEPDLAIAVHVLRSSRDRLDVDENGAPTQQAWLPRNLLVEGAILEERVAQLERLSRTLCDGALFVLYSNEARRRTAVDTRDVASWASWQTPLDTLWWTVRHFRAKAR